MENERMLRNALKANVIFSMLSAIAALALSNSISSFMELANGNAMAFSLQLFVFAGFVLFNALRKGVSSVMIYIIIGLDVLFIIGSFLRIAIEPLSTGGIVLILVSSAVVATLAYLQFKGLRVVRASAN